MTSNWCWATIAVRTPRPLSAANTRRNTPAACASSRANVTWAGVPTTAARSRPAAGNTWPTATATTGGATPASCRCRPTCWNPTPRAGCAIRAPATITRTPASPNPITRSTLPTSTACFAGSPSPTAPRWRAATSSPATMPRYVPTSTPNGLPTTPRCGSGSRSAAVCATSRPSRRCTAACRRA